MKSKYIQEGLKEIELENSNFSETPHPLEVEKYSFFFT